MRIPMQKDDSAYACTYLLTKHQIQNYYARADDDEGTLTFWMYIWH